MAETPEELREEPAEHEDEDAPLAAEADDEAELGCTVEGGLVRL
jgi:hypothetical protein